MLVGNPQAKSAKKQRPLRIAVIGVRGIPNDYSGLERSCELLFPLLAERGHEVTVYCRPGALRERRESYRGVRLVVTPALPARSVETTSHVITSLAHAVGARHYDLIHLHALAPNLFAPICGMAKLPLIATVHGLDWQRAKWEGLASKVLKMSERTMVRYADEIICVSRDLQNYYMQKYRRPTTYIPNGIALTGQMDGEYKPILEAFGLAGKMYVVSAGRLVPEKRIQDLIAAFATIDIDCRLAIVGDGRYNPEYVNQLRILSERDHRVVFTGHQSREALSTLLSQAAAYVSASELEGLPNAVLEGITHGIPVVLSDIPPHQELLSGVAEYDLFFSVGDLAALAERLRSVVVYPAKYQSIASRARADAERRYNWASIAVATEEVYYQAMRRHQRKPAKRRPPLTVSDSGRITR